MNRCKRSHVVATVIGLAVTVVAAVVIDGGAAAGTAADGEFGVQIIEGETLEAAGVTRLSGLIRMLDGWGATTVDGFTWRGSPAGLSPLDLQQWTVSIDGRPIGINSFGSIGLNRLPVDVNRIERIKVYTLPGICNGRLIEDGLIDIQTTGGGRRLQVRMAAENETGDSGPYRFTELATPNVERIGPDFSLGAWEQRERSGAGGALMWMEHYPIDAATLNRNSAISAGEEIVIQLGAASITASTDRFGGRHDVLITYSHLEDFFFFKPYGQEIPVTSRLVHAGLDSEWDIGQSTQVGVGLGYGSNTLEHRTNARYLDFDWRPRRLDVVAHATRATERVDVTIGAGSEFIHAKTGFGLTDRDVLVGRIGANVTCRWNRSHRELVYASMAAGEGDVAFGARILHTWSPPNGGRSLGLGVVYSERLPADDHRFWFWNERGYAFLEDGGVDVGRAARLDVARVASVDAFWREYLGGSFDMELRAYLRRSAGLQLERQVFRYVPLTESFFAPVELVSDQSGRVGGLGAQLAYRPASSWVWMLRYWYQREMGGDRLFEESWNKLPRHGLRLQTTWTPVPSLALWASLEYWSGSRWAEYVEVEEQSGGRYPATIDDRFNLELTIQKWFWKRRLRGDLGFRNLLDRTIRYHPVGASFDLSAFLQVEFLWQEAGSK